MQHSIGIDCGLDLRIEQGLLSPKESAKARSHPPSPVPNMKTNRHIPLLILAISFTGACSSPYIVTRQLRGVPSNNLYYIYPPGSDPAKPVQVAVPLAPATDAECAAKVAQSKWFTLHFRKAACGARAAMVRDKGSLPASRGDFEADLVTLIEKAKPCLKSDEAAAVGKRLRERLPRSFVDELYDRYRFDTLDRKIDLEAGMRLRFEWQAFNVPDFGDSTLSSYIGAGTSYIMVARRPQGIRTDQNDSGFLTFEPFLGWTDTEVERIPNRRIAGSLDFEGPTHKRKFYRLILPVSFGNSAQASNKPSKLVMLLGANSLEGLDKADTDKCGRESDSASDPICTPVAGRTLVVPEVPVRINGRDEYLPVGTTLRQIIDRGVRPWTPRSSLPLLRSHHGHLTSVVFIDPQEDALFLPLEKGDRFSW